MSRRGWVVLGGVAALAFVCTCAGLAAVAGLWYASRSDHTVTPTVAIARNDLPSDWRMVRTQDGRVAVVATATETTQANALPFQPGLFWYQEPLPQPLNPLQYAGVIYLRLQQQNQALYAYDARWVALSGWPTVQLAYAAVQQGQPYEGVLWIWTDGWNGYVMSFVTPYGTLASYVAELPTVVGGVTSQVVAEPGPLAGGQVPDVWTPDYWQSNAGQGEIPAAWDWSAVDASAPAFSGFEDPFAGATWDGSTSDLWSDLASGDSGGLYDPSHDAFNTWMAEEWSQMLSGENPEPTWQDDAGNLYWEGPSGTLHDWSADYDPSLGSDW
ncbi:hypothetical protein OO015_13230 [Thermomicrobium sp. 4228-Ro]|uniref:hypothetical protein n=1 Tax=Thermomicrobium sp. 4228-Ro TaxID=2993937 RepID=UPI002248F07F|nr:hypothetical protein [Thermomicrobium sp. 4228-Ro]MCX2728450.1 hypothetical protein [Thermomicrobium sp. 4228-Ro]